MEFCFLGSYRKQLPRLGLKGIEWFVPAVQGHRFTELFV